MCVIQSRSCIPLLLATGSGRVLPRISCSHVPVLVSTQEMEAKARNTRLDHWLAPGIIVKVMSKELKEAGYYKQKVRSQATGVKALGGRGWLGWQALSETAHPVASAADRVWRSYFVKISVPVSHRSPLRQSLRTEQGFRSHSLSN